VLGAVGFSPGQEKAGVITPKRKEALADNVPKVFSGIATFLLMVMAYLAVLGPA